jgi:transcriptional regulator with XRE-family HTH domain/mannose-6-phosphate isomerase-like protein (cupin superfamily)
MAAFAEPAMPPVSVPPAHPRGSKRPLPMQRLESRAAISTPLQADASTAPQPTASLAVDPAEPDDLAADSVSTEAAETVIEAKRIGERIKYLRQRKQMGLVELGRHTGLSASFLSQLETGRVVPTLRNLARVAMVFSKDLSYFFEPERPELFRIQRASGRQRLPQTGVEQPGYFYESLGHIPADQSGASSLPQPVAPYLTEFLAPPEPAPADNPPAQARPAHCHEGREFLYMLSGRLQLAHDAATETLEQGDAVYFDAAAPHSYERLGDDPCTAMILTLPEPPRGSHTGSRIPLVKPPSKKR